MSQDGTGFSYEKKIIFKDRRQKNHDREEPGRGTNPMEELKKIWEEERERAALEKKLAESDNPEIAKQLQEKLKFMEEERALRRNLELSQQKKR